MSLRLNHKDCVDSYVPLVDILERILIRDQESILFVGEGDFSFTLAFAALRASMCGSLKSKWRGITSTRYELRPKPRPSEVKQRCMDSCTEEKYIQHFPSSSKKSHQDIIECLEKFPDINDDVWQFGVDALSLSQELVGDHQVIWFQCPWTSPRDKTTLLISDFLLNLAEKIECGIYVCIGITKQFPYIKSYGLENILGEGLRAEENKTKVLRKYDFEGADCELVEKVLEFGYHHITCHEGRDIHDEIFAEHLTLVFKRKASNKKKKIN